MNDRRNKYLKEPNVSDFNEAIIKPNRRAGQQLEPIGGARNLSVPNALDAAADHPITSISPSAARGVAKLQPLGEIRHEKHKINPAALSPIQQAEPTRFRNLEPIQKPNI